MEIAIQHLTSLELEAGLAEVLESPTDVGALEAIVVRPTTNERQRLTSVRLAPEIGVEGDQWAQNGFYKTEEGGPDPRSQVSIMNARFLRQIAGDDDAIALAGDNLIVDLDLSDANLPTGSRLQIGEQVILEITETKHTGCSKFAKRYGNDAKTFANNERGTALHLRGRYARIITGGTISVGDSVRKAPLDGTT